MPWKLYFNPRFWLAMGVCGSKSVDSASDSSESDSEVASRNNSLRRASYPSGSTSPKIQVPEVSLASQACTTASTKLYLVMLQTSAVPADPAKVKLIMTGPKAGRQRMAIAAESAAAHSQVEIVRAAKTPAVLAILGESVAVCAQLQSIPVKRRDTAQKHSCTRAAHAACKMHDRPEAWSVWLHMYASCASILHHHLTISLRADVNSGCMTSSRQSQCMCSHGVAGTHIRAATSWLLFIKASNKT